MKVVNVISNFKSKLDNVRYESDASKTSMKIDNKTKDTDLPDIYRMDRKGNIRSTSDRKSSKSTKKSNTETVADVAMKSPSGKSLVSSEYDENIKMTDEQLLELSDYFPNDVLQFGEKLVEIVEIDTDRWIVKYKFKMYDKESKTDETITAELEYDEFDKIAKASIKELETDEL